MKTQFTGIRITRSYLVIEFHIQGQLIPHKHVVRVPWRRLNQKYEEVAGAMASEAQRELRRTPVVGQPALPLEVWE